MGALKWVVPRWRERKSKDQASVCQCFTVVLRISGSKSTQDGQKKTLQWHIQSSYKSFEINLSSWEKQAQDRLLWQSCTGRGGSSKDSKNTKKCESSANSFLSIPYGQQCLICVKDYRTRMGLIGHSRTHRVLSFLFSFEMFLGRGRLLWTN